jgi:Cyclin
VYIFIELFVKLFKELTSDHVVVALIYIERLLQAVNEKSGESAVLTDYNGKGVLHSALALAAKFNQDGFEKNTEFYKAVLPFNMRKMRQMTDAFINFLDFNLYVS